MDEWDKEIQFDLTDALEQLPTIFDRYLEHQKDALSMDAINDLKAGYVRLTSKTGRVKADMEVYLELCRFVAHCNSLTAPETTELLHVLKKITSINGEEIPLPQSYTELQKNVVLVLAKHKIPVLQSEFDLPREIFGLLHSPHQSGTNNVTNI